MRATGIEQGGAGGTRRLGFRTEFAQHDPVSTWFEWAGDAPLAAPGDVLLAALLPGALATREDLRIDGVVSAGALAAARERVLPTLVRFHPGYDPIEIHAAEVAEDAALPPRAAGCIATFSGGLDSSYTLVRHRERLSHLVFVHGLDVGLRAPHIREQVRADLEKTAHAFDLELLDGSSRIRPTLYRAFQRVARARADRPVRFLLEWAIGCLLAAFGQLFVERAGRILIAGSWDDQYAGATGSHPELEPAWSTPRLAVELDGTDASRIDKALHLAEHAPEVLRNLRVCQRRPYRTKNCGACPKCLRLRMELRAAGVPAELHPFETTLSERALRHSFVNIDGYFWPEIVRRAEARGDRETARTAEIMMDRHFRLGREIARFRARRRHPGRKYLRRGGGWLAT